MPRRLFATLISVCLISFGFLGCSSDVRTKERVQSDLKAHFEKVGLDVNRLDVSVTEVTFDKNLARATVAFSPKGAANVHDGIVMHYMLEDKGGHWVVTGRSDSQGHGMGMGAAGTNPNLPPGHPPMGGDTPMANPTMPRPRQPLPPGHPQVQGTPSPSNGQALPPGHPKV